MAALILGNALAGCAFLKDATAYHPPVTDSPEAMQAEMAGFQLPKLPDPGMAMVYVVRPSSIGLVIRFNVFVDDHEATSEMGYTRGGQHVYFQVPPGEHVIYSKAENWAEAQISPKAGETVFLQQRPGIGVLIARNSVSVIDAVLGKYHVMHTSRGAIIRTERLGPAAEARKSAEAALLEKEIAKADWRSLAAGASVKIYSKEGAFTGQFVSYNGDYLWIAIGDGKKALSPSEIEKVVVFR